MKYLPLEIGNHPDHVYRIACYAVPRAARREFEEAMRRSADVLRTLPGFRGHLVLEKAGGETRFDLVSVAVWESEAALANAVEPMRAHQASLGIDLAARLAEWEVAAERGNYVLPPHLQEPMES